MSVGHFAREFIGEEDAQDVVEYGLLMATVSIVVLVATQAFGSQITTWFGALSGRITTNS